MPALSRHDHLRRRLAALKAEYASWLPHHREISDMVLPRRGRFVATDRNKGSRRNRKIIDNTATLALRTLASGLMGGLTSPARPWFRLAPRTPGLEEDGAVKLWLDDVEHLLREIFNRSNIYNALFSVYEELGAFGTAAMLVYEDHDTVVSCEALTAGQYYIAPGKNGVIDTLYRECSLTVAQAVDEFVRVAPGRHDWSRASPALKSLWDNNALDAWVEIVQAVEPNPDFRPDSKLARHKPWVSVWIEAGANQTVLRQSGFDEFPALCPRWNLTGPDIYGSSPAMDALGDVEQLQMQEKEKSKAIQKMVSPPVNVPSTLKAESVLNVMPGGVTFYDAASGAPMATPLYQVQPRVAEMQQDMEQVRQRIREAFHTPLFRMISEIERSGITATEINARREEKLLMLGPVLERLHHELLDPLIDRVFAVASRAGLLPPPPEALAADELRVDYISMLAQAQRSVATGTVDRMVAFVGGLLQIAPETADKIDFDQAVDVYADALGVAPAIILPDKHVAQIREARAQAQQQQQAMEAAQAASQPAMEAAQALSQQAQGLAGADAGAGNRLPLIDPSAGGGMP